MEIKTTYAVLWQHDTDEAAPGHLSLLPRGFWFTPADASTVTEEVRFEDVSSLRIAAAPDDEIDGQPTLVVERRAGNPIRIANVARTSLAAELADGLAAVALGNEQKPARLLVIVPIKEGKAARARALLQSGPPFTPDKVGLERHEAFLTSSEAAFLFETLDGDAALQQLLSSKTVWEAAPAWRGLIAGPPRVAEVIYSWEQGRIGAQA